MSELKMSKAALEAQHHYNNVERWENKAKKLYGKYYEPAKPGETISAQALDLRRAEGRKYRLKYAESHKRANVAFWERKAKQMKEGTKT